MVYVCCIILLEGKEEKAPPKNPVVFWWRYKIVYNKKYHLFKVNYWKCHFPTASKAVNIIDKPAEPGIKHE